MNERTDRLGTGTPLARWLVVAMGCVLSLACVLGFVATRERDPIVTASEPEPPSSSAPQVESSPGNDEDPVATQTPEAAPVPSIAMPAGFQVLAPGRTLPLELHHLRFGRVRTLAIRPDEVNEAARYLGHYRPEDDPLDKLPKAWRSRAQSKILNVGQPRAKAVEPFDPFENSSAQIALVVFDAPGHAARVALVQRGELQVLLKLSHSGEGLVWVTTAQGEVVPGATVTLRQGRSVRHTTRTNGEGIAKLPARSKLVLKYEPDLEWEDDYFRPLMAFASKGGKLGFTSQSWTTGIEPWEFDIPMAYYYGSGKLVGSVNPERGIYRPGHSVHLVGAVRKREANGKLGVPRGKVLVRVLDPDYTSVASEQVSLTEFGTFRLEAKLPVTARLGRYSVEATVGDTTLYSQFRVAKYRPNRFEVNVAEREPVVLGKDSELTVTTTAKYLYGSPVASGKVSYDVSLRPARSHDEEGFSSGIESHSYEEEEVRTLPLHDDEGELMQGAHTLKLPLSDVVENAHPTAQRLELLVSASVTDAADDTISGHRAIGVQRSSHTTWIKNRAWVVDAKNGWDVEVKSTGEGALEGEPVTVELYRREWISTALENDSGTRYSGSYETRRVSTQTLKASERPQRVHLTLDRGGSYSARVFAGDGTTYAEARVWAYGGDSYGRFDNQPRLGVHSDRAHYEPGQTARLLIESPYESSLALVTLEQEGVLSARTQKLSGAGSEVKVALTGAHLPNVYANISLVPRTAGQYGVAGSPLKSGYVALQVSPEKQRLKVEIRPEKREARPGETVPVSVKLTDASGKPVRGEVTLWASDEGVLRLTGYETPDVFSPIYRAHYLGVSTASSLLRFTDLGYDDDGMGGDSAPNGDGHAAFRSRFLETAFFSRGVVTDAKGQATLQLPLPDNITRWRVMAAAADSGARFGSAQVDLTTKKPVQVSPSLPRFLTVGDELLAGVVVHNDRAQGGSARVTLAAEGVDSKGSSVQELRVEPHSQTTVTFPVAATRMGQAIFSASVTLDGEQDGFRIALPVHSPTEKQSNKVLDAVVSAERTLAISLPDEADPHTAELTLESAPGDIAILGAALDSLMDYPHGCTEQTTSRLIPMAQLGELLSGHPVFASETHRHKMQAAVVHLLGHQNASGGFGLWPESEAEGFLTAYALFGLELARESGLEVPNAAIDGAYRYLTEHDGDVQGYGTIGEGARRPFAALVFNRAKRPLPSGLVNLFADANELTPFGQALLVAGHPTHPESNAVLEAVLKPESTQTNGEWYPGNRSLQQDAGNVLALVAKQRHHDARSSVDAILRARTANGDFGSTQDNLWALTALQGYYSTRPPSASPTLRATLASVVEQPGRSAPSVRLESTRERPYARAEIPLVDGQSRLTVTPERAHGTGRVVARVSFHARADAHRPTNAGFEVERRLLDHATGAPVSSLAVGQLVTVELELRAAGGTGQVALVDRLPAGLEAVDLELATAPQLTAVSRDYSWVFREAHDERVAFFSNWLPGGSRTVRYVARATRKGTFVHPPPRVDAMYQPDVYGVGSIGSVVVR